MTTPTKLTQCKSKGHGFPMKVINIRFNADTV